MKIYTISKTESWCSGHGESTTEDMIVRNHEGWTPTDFPPAFMLKEDAEAYLKSFKDYEQHGKQVVELELK